MSRSPVPTSALSNYQSIFDSALKAYKKKTKIDLRSHPLFARLETCDSPPASLALLLEHTSRPGEYCSSSGGLSVQPDSIVNVLHTFSGTIHGDSSLVGLRGQG